MTTLFSTLPLVAAALPLAHIGDPALGPRNWHELARAWEWEPLMVAALLLTAWLYRRGARRLRAETGPQRGLRWWEIASFWAGWWTLVVALLSPLHPWGKILFAAHMTQHELLMVAAAPLLVLGRPIVAFLFALPRPDARQISRIARVPAVRRTWTALTDPLVAWLLHAAALWLWHVPRFFQATLTNEFVHDCQHISFLGSALLFWWALIHGRAGWRGFGLAVLYLFTTMAHTGLLGALLTFANIPVYPAYASAPNDWQLTPLEDQQLGGLIMWIPAGLVYMVAALALVAGWMRSSDRELRLDAINATAGRATLLFLCVLVFTSCASRRVEEAAAKTGGDPALGQQIIRRYGCGACHTISGVPGAQAHVGPPLTGIGSRDYIGGVLPNTPDNMIRWILDPPAHSPKTVMPKLGLTEREARDVTAYLYTLTDN